MSTVEIFGLRLWKDGFEAGLAALEKASRETHGAPAVVVTPNVDHLVRLRKNPELFERYRKSEFIFPDGFPVVASSRLFGKKIKERVTGADLFPALCSVLAKKRGRVFILGGRPGTENEMTKKLAAKYPGLEVRCMAPAYGFSAEGPEGAAAARMVNEMKPHAVFVCLGMPRQEDWTFRYRNSLKAGVVLCVGAALEFDLGLVKRAPKAVQKAGMEWLWRLFSNPGRLWKRYLIDDLGFLKLLLVEATGRSNARK